MTTISFAQTSFLRLVCLLALFMVVLCPRVVNGKTMGSLLLVANPGVPQSAQDSARLIVTDAHFGVVKSRYANIRRKPDQSSERVTQALFMDGLHIVRKQGEWLEVRIISQREYPGWIHSSLVDIPAPNGFDRNAEPETLIVVKPDTRVFGMNQTDRDTGFLVLRGTYLSAIGRDSTGAKIVLPSGSGWVSSENYVTLDSLRRRPAGALRSSLVGLAREFLGVRYLWGGTTELGFDCSGLVYLCYRLNGILLERDGIPQFQDGFEVTADRTQPGDLIYFTTYKPGPSHTGILTESRSFIHASSSRGVTENCLDEGYWQERYYGTVSYLKNTPAFNGSVRPMPIPPKGLTE